MRRLRLLLGIIALGVLMLVTAAQGSEGPSQGDLNAARALATAGFELYEAGEYEKAIERFGSAEALIHAPTHLLYMARAEAKLGHLLAAREHYRNLVTEKLAADAPQPFRDAQQIAQRELTALDSRIPSVAIALPGQAAEKTVVTIDGEPVARDALAAPVPLDPGTHAVKARLAGWPEVVQQVSLRDGGGVQEVELAVGPQSAKTERSPEPDPTLPPDQDQASGPSIVAPVVLMSAGGALLVVGGITGAMTLSDAAELKDKCPQNPCPAEHEPLRDSVHTLGTVSTVAFVVGGAAVGAGLLWLLLQPSGDAPQSEVGKITLAPYAGLYGGGLRGTF